ncbi:unnamed protein product, partial [Timema podura]|nr:unnamed protein product [Timema podura]
HVLSEVKEGFGNQINLCRDRGLSLRPPAPKSDTLPLDHQLANAPVVLSQTTEDGKIELDQLYKLVELEVKGHDTAVLKSYEWFAKTAARELGITVGNCWSLRKPNKNRLTLLKSVFIYKKHRVQYEIRTQFHFLQFHNLTGSTADTFLEYIQRNLPEGVAMKVTKVAVQALPKHLVPPEQAVNVEESK